MSKTNDYWRKREEDALRHYISEERKYDKELKKIYADMLAECRAEIDRFYGKYAAAEKITITEAKRRVAKLDIEAYERKAKRYVKEKNFSQRANEEMRLYNATMKINRLEMLKANIGLELISGHDELDRFMAEVLKGRTMDELTRQAGILGKTIRGNAKMANSIVNASFHNATFSQRVWSNLALLQNELNQLLQRGLIQGKNPRELARDLRKAFDSSVYHSERLMRTELARVQIDAQKKSFEENGFEHYEFIANANCCDSCQRLNGKHFEVKKMTPGENAAPLHPNCRCSVAAWEDSEDYDAWLDYLSKGGTTENWSSYSKNLAKAIDSMYIISEEGATTYTKQEIIDEMSKSPIGRQVVTWIENSDVRIVIREDECGNGNRGEQRGKNINIYPKNIKSLRVAAQTLIHEMGHYYYNIGKSQHAEAICFGLEKLHLTGNQKLTVDEWEYVKKLSIDNYPEYNWEDGGYGEFEKIQIVDK